MKNKKIRVKLATALVFTAIFISILTLTIEGLTNKDRLFLLTVYSLNSVVLLSNLKYLNKAWLRKRKAELDMLYLDKKK